MSRGSRTSPQSGQGQIDLGTDKTFFKIGEAAEIVGVAPHVLRYWEGEFRTLRPQKSKTQQRVYRREDIFTLLKIKHLLYEQRFTVAGARQQLKEPEQSSAIAAPSGIFIAKQSLRAVREALEDVKAFVAVGIAEPAADPARWLRKRHAGPGA